MNQLARYDAMCHAIAECHAVDEVKDIRDKAMALEHYAKQAKNTDAERKAADVRLRAERRMGELLKTLGRMSRQESGRLGGLAKSSKSHDGTRQKSEYDQALEATGLSKQSASRYQQLANVPEETFERALAEPVKKPTARGLIGESRREQQKPIDPQALRVWGVCRDLERHDDLSASPSRIFNEMTETMQADIRRLAPMVLLFWSGITEVSDQ